MPIVIFLAHTHSGHDIFITCQPFCFISQFIKGWSLLSAMATCLGRREKHGPAWNCGDYNRPIRKRIFAIPQFKCACGREVSLLHCMNCQLHIPLVSFLYRCFLSISNWRIMTCTSLWWMLKSVGFLWFPSSLTRKAVSNPYEQCYITDCQFLHCFACNIFFFCFI